MYGSITHGDVVLCLTLYSTQAPLDFFEMQTFENIMKKWSICSWGANVPCSIIFSKLVKCKNYLLENIWKFELFIENDAMF